METAFVKDGQYHFIGIGGIGMSGIAQLLLACGKRVSGSDVKRNANIESLEAAGARIFIGHQAENVDGAALVVYSSAVKDDNPEIIEAKRKGIPIIKRAQALAELMKQKKVITVSGSHGKTTTTSLVSYLLLEAGLSPTAAIGGILRNIGTNVCLGTGDYFVAEADESDGSFLYYTPRYSIITNIDREHLDYYHTFENVVQAYREFLNRTEEGGCVFACEDDSELKRMLGSSPLKCVFFGLHSSADIYPKNIVLKNLSSRFDCYYKKIFVERFELSLGGTHNISNALAVIALGLELGIGLDVIRKILAGYKGAQRRLEIKYTDRDVQVIDDYAHHPTEIRATLAAVRSLNPSRLVVVFQPHRYTRTQLLLDDFGACFSLADTVVITDIYPANELPIEGVSAERLCDKIKEQTPDKDVRFVRKSEIVEYLVKNKKNGDVILTLGAGDIIKCCDELVEELKRKGSV